MTSVDIIRMYETLPWYKKAVGLRYCLTLAVNTEPGMVYNIMLLRMEYKWLWITLKEYIPNG